VALVEVLLKAAIGLRLVDRRQVGALQVLDEAELQGILVAHGADDHRHVVQLCLLRRPPAPFAGDDLVGVGRARDRPHQDRLQEAELLHRFDQHLDILEGGARLHLAGLEMADRQSERRPTGRGAVRRLGGGRLRRGRRRGHCRGDFLIAQQGGQTAAQAAQFRGLAHDRPHSVPARRRCAGGG
jgi:hypothetical protein